jgi:hypothetical protein
MELDKLRLVAIVHLVTKWEDFTKEEALKYKPDIWNQK